MSKSGMSLIVGGCMFLCAVLGYVIVLVFAPGQDARGIFTFAAIFATAIGISGQIAEVRDTAKTVEKQTNGALSAKHEELIEKAASAAATKAVYTILANESVAQRQLRHDDEPPTRKNK